MPAPPEPTCETNSQTSNDKANLTDSGSGGGNGGGGGGGGGGGETGNGTHRKGGGGGSGIDLGYTLEPAPAADFEGIDPNAPGDAVVFFQEESDDGDEEDERRLQHFALRVIYDPKRNGLEESVNFPISVDTFITSKYQIVDYLGSGVFSRAVQCVELATGRMVCVKIIRNNKDFLDQSLGEIKLLKILNESDPHDEKHVLRMEDYFYYREHLFIVCELLRDNLYELYKYISKSGWAPYFTLPRVKAIGRQVLVALDHIHSLNLIHCDLKVRAPRVPAHVLPPDPASCDPSHLSRTSHGPIPVSAVLLPAVRSRRTSSSAPSQSAT